MNTSLEVPERVDLKTLRLGSLIDVETKSRHYHIECLGGNAIRVSGHPEYCPQPMPAQLLGCVDKEGEFIEPGMKLMFFISGDRAVRTSKIISVKLAQPDAVQSYPSVH
jgi:hypothetical protein